MVYNDSRGLENCRLRAVTFESLHNNVMSEFCISNVDEMQICTFLYKVKLVKSNL